MSMNVDEARNALSEKIGVMIDTMKLARQSGDEAAAAAHEKRLQFFYNVRRSLGKTVQPDDLPAAMFTPWQPGQHASASMQPHHRELLDRIIAEHPVYSQRANATTTDPAPTLKLVQPPSKPTTDWKQQASDDWEHNRNGCRDQYRSFHAYEALLRTRAQAQPVTPPDDAPVATDADDVLHDAIERDWQRNAGDCQNTFRSLYAYRAFRVSKRA